MTPLLATLIGALFMWAVAVAWFEMVSTDKEIAKRKDGNH